MLISELIGYRENPIYQKAKTTFDPSEYGDTEGAFWATRNRMMKNFTSELVKHGFVKVGSGVVVLVQYMRNLDIRGYSRYSTGILPI